VWQYAIVSVASVDAAAPSRQRDIDDVRLKLQMPRPSNARSFTSVIGEINQSSINECTTSTSAIFEPDIGSDMESPNKRQRLSGQSQEVQADFVALGGDEDDTQYGYGANTENDGPPADAPTGSGAKQAPNGRGHFRRDGRNDPRNAKDRPRSKHILPGYEPWILVRTRYGRRFAHNTQTKESFWYIPKDVMSGVLELERQQKDEKEQAQNARWAEEQLKEMEAKSKAAKVNQKADAEESSRRRRRSESLQREDEEAFMAELAKQAEEAEEQDAKEAVEAVEHREEQQGPRPGDYASDSDYEYVEVTDTEGEGDDEDEEETRPEHQIAMQDDAVEEQEEDGPVEFGEDDIAFQLAAMGQDYGLDPGEYDQNEESYQYEEGDEGLPLSEEDAVNLFRDMLEDHRLSPFTPWDRVIADEGAESVLMDDRFTVLTSSRARKEAWDAWTKDKAAAIREERARMAKLDPKIPYLALLAEKASPKLYWPEFKRKFRKDAEMNDRKLGDKDREKLYREHINRLKLPESTRKADLTNLLKSIPLSALNKTSNLDSLPQALLSHLHFISLPTPVRDCLVEKHIKNLPGAPDVEDGEMTEEQRAEEEKKRTERRKREAALADRERKVQEEKRRQEMEERRAKGMLRESERDLGRY